MQFLQRRFLFQLPFIAEEIMKTFVKKNVLITGGSSGIGFALAKQLVAAGANVWILARRENLLDEALAQLQQNLVSKDQKIGKIKADVSNFSDLRLKLDAVFNEKNIPDLLINSAGVVHPGEFLELSPEDYTADISIDYLGTVYTTKIIAPLMVKNRSGHIVNVCSLAGLVSIYGYSAYSPAKYAVKSFSSILRTELAPYNILVSVVYPGDTDTPQLEYDNAHKPAITRELSETMGLMSAAQAAKGIIKGIQKGKHTIMPSLLTKILKPFASPLELIMRQMAISKVKKSR
jgi:3-dehydrosphinganine reductase